MLTWSIEKTDLPLKYTWKISRNASESKTNLLVSVTDGVHTGVGEAAPNIRYQETPDSLYEEFHRHQSQWPAAVMPFKSYLNLIDGFALPKALRFAVESAYLHFLAVTAKIPVHQILELPPPGPAFTSYTIPIMDPGAMKSFYDEYKLHRFRYIKLKVNAETAFDAVACLASFSDRPMMIDANEAFTDPDSCIRWLEKIKSFRIEFVEQPMSSSLSSESLYLKKFCPLPLIADESITFDPDFSMLKLAFDGINMKLMKAGGYINGIRILKEARRNGMKTMIGCMVETSLGISSALQLESLADYTDLDSFLLLKDEPLKLVSEEEGTLRLR